MIIDECMRGYIKPEDFKGMDEPSLGLIPKGLEFWFFPITRPTKNAMLHGMKRSPDTSESLKK